MVLVNSFIQSLSIYWFSLTLLPKLVIKNIRNKIFHLLWLGGHWNLKLHLSSWEILDLPRKLGGWGITVQSSLMD